MKLPMVYSLKREVFRKKVRFGPAESLGGIASAPVFLFEMDEVVGVEAGLAKDRLMKEATPLNGPYQHYLFETQDKGRNFGDKFAIYGIDDGGNTKVFYFFSHFIGNWHVMCRLIARCTPSASEELPFSIEYDFPKDDLYDPQVFAILSMEDPHPSKGFKEAIKDISLAIIIRGLAILNARHTQETVAVSRVKRQMLNAPGISGWDYKILKIDSSPDVQSVSYGVPEAPGGTHASPRWHMRRGHWRMLRSGRRVFVRASEVGDKDRGGVVKDYKVCDSEQRI